MSLLRLKGLSSKVPLASSLPVLLLSTTVFPKATVAFGLPNLT